MQFLKVAFFALAAASQTSALGINCRGSSNCAGNLPVHTLSEINTYVQTSVRDNDIYGNGEHIACAGYVCAFLQNVDGTKTGKQIKGYVTQLLAHGCGKCGSVPTEPGNNVNTGELTCNWTIGKVTKRTPRSLSV